MVPLVDLNKPAGADRRVGCKTGQFPFICVKKPLKLTATLHFSILVIWQTLLPRATYRQQNLKITYFLWLNGVFLFLHLISLALFILPTC
jgi:hypothetical protein